MKKITLITLLLIATGSAFAQYKPTTQGSSIQFTIKNFGFNVTGTFTGLKGDIKFDPADPGSAGFDVTIDASSVNTDNSLRDEHLQGESYFDVKPYPTIHFVSTKVSAGKNGIFTLTGKLTIKKTTKLISFPFSATAAEGGYEFKGAFPLNRKDFDIGGTSAISDNLDVLLHISAKKGS